METHYSHASIHPCTFPSTNSTSQKSIHKTFQQIVQREIITTSAYYTLPSSLILVTLRYLISAPVPTGQSTRMDPYRLHFSVSPWLLQARTLVVVVGEV